jgi:hypothetical protein
MRRWSAMHTMKQETKQISNGKQLATAKQEIAATVETAKTESPFSTFNATGRENAQLQFGIGLNAFNVYVGENNVNNTLFNLAREYADTVKLAMVNSESEAVFYTVKGKGGMQGGACELYRFDISGKEYDVLRHPNGSWVFADMVRGLRIVREKEIIDVAAKGNDLRQFKVIAHEGGKETLFAGALIGDMNDKRQGLVVRTENGLAIVCLTTGRIGYAEKADRAVEIGALNDADKATLRAQIFGGVLATRAKQDRRNHAKRTNKALKDAAASSVAKVS